MEEQFEDLAGVKVTVVTSDGRTVKIETVSSLSVNESGVLTVTRSGVSWGFSPSGWISYQKTY